MSAYRPSAVARFVFTLDEGRQTAALLAKLEPAGKIGTSAISTGASGATTSAQLGNALGQVSILSKLDQLTGGVDPTLVAELNKALAKKRALASFDAQYGAFGQRIPEAVSGFSAADVRTATLGSVPLLSASVDRKGFRSMDEASFELNYQEVPFDPRLMRAAAVEITIGVVSDVEFDAGMHGLKRADGTLYSQVEQPAGFTAETRFFGFVNEWEIEFSESGAVVRGTARDVMSIIRDTPLPAGVSIDLRKPINVGVQELLDSFPALRGIPITFGKGGVPGVVGPIPLAAVAKRKLLVNGGKASRARRMAENSTVWDHITDTCVAVGVTPVIRAWGINLQFARTLYGPDPSVPRMVWGQNLSTLRFKRSMAGFKNPTVEVRSFSADTRKVFAARYPAIPGLNTAIVGVTDFPDQPMRANRVPPSGANPDETIRVLTVANVESLTTLAKIARNVYEETARQEIEGSFSTRDPSFFGDDFGAATLLDVHAGDPIRITLDQRRAGDVADVVTLMQGLTPPERLKKLVDAGFNARLAGTLVALIDASNLQTVFRVQEARLAWSHDDGLTIDVSFCNYIAVRDDPTSPDAIEEDPSDRVADAVRGQTGPTSAKARAASAAKAQARALGQAGTGPGSTAAQQSAETGAVQTSGQLFSDPDEPQSQ